MQTQSSVFSSRPAGTDVQFGGSKPTSKLRNIGLAAALAGASLLSLGQAAKALPQDTVDFRPVAAKSKKDATTGQVVEVTDATFEREVLQSPIPVLVDFSAPWCHWCVKLEPTLHELAREYQDRVKVVKINVDNNSNTTRSYGIEGLPTLLVFQKGQVKEQLVGYKEKSQLTEVLNRHLR